MDNKKLKFKRLAKEIYGTCPGTTNDKQKQLFQMQLINTVDKNKTFFTKRQQVELREQENYLIRLDSSQLKISKWQFE